MGIGGNFIKYFIPFLLCFLLSCNFIFKPEKRIIKKIQYKGICIEWYKMNGILDQTFPNGVILIEDSKTDTICNAYNIANVDVIGDTITLWFYGDPHFLNTIPQEINKYQIKVDTVYEKQDNIVNINNK